MTRRSPGGFPTSTTRSLPRRTSSCRRTTSSTQRRRSLEKVKEKNPALYNRIIGQYAFLGGRLRRARRARDSPSRLSKPASSCSPMTVAVPAVTSLWTACIFSTTSSTSTPTRGPSTTTPGTLREPAAQLPALQQRLPRRSPREPGLHWSKLPEAHAKIESEIAPILKQKSVWWLLVPSVRPRCGRALARQRANGTRSGSPTERWPHPGPKERGCRPRRRRHERPKRPRELRAARPPSGRARSCPAVLVAVEGALGLTVYLAIALSNT